MPPSVANIEVHPDEEAKLDSRLDRLINEKTLVINELIAKDASSILQKLATDNSVVEDWARLLRAAPTAITSLGFCFAAAKTAGTGNVTQSKNTKLPGDLKVNIMDCHDKGISVFKRANEKMSRLVQTIDAILEPSGTMDSIAETIEEAQENIGDQAGLQRSQAELIEFMKELKEAAETCETSSKCILQAFDEWKDLTNDIHSAFLDTLSRTATPKPEKTGTWSAISGAFSKKAKSLSSFLRRSSSAEETMTNSTPEEREAIKQVFLSATETDVLTILRFCLDNLQKITGSLEELHDFFFQLNEKISNITTERVPKLNTLATGDEKVRGSVANGKYPKKIQLEVLKIRMDYMIAGAKAAMYTKASKSHIMPGVYILLSLSEETGDTVDGYQLDKLIDYSEKTNEEITRLIRSDKKYATETSHKAILPVIGPKPPTA